MSDLDCTPHGERWEIRAGDLPIKVQKQANDTVAHYAVPLLLENRLAGSGTLIKCGKVHGILTAHHVVHNPNDRTRRFDFHAGSRQKLMLAVTDVSHMCEFEMQHLQCIDIGVPKDDYSGPDISVIILPNVGPQMGEIRVRKSFYDVSWKREERLAASLSNDGLWIVVGTPIKMERREGPSHGFDYVVGSIGVGALTGIKERFDGSDFDFLHLIVDYPVATGMPNSFEGMSGGGVWSIPLLKKKDAPLSEIRLGDEILSGVVFFQTPVRDNLREIRCHAGKSIYNKVFEKLVALPLQGSGG